MYRSDGSIVPHDLARIAQGLDDLGARLNAAASRSTKDFTDEKLKAWWAELEAMFRLRSRVEEKMEILHEANVTVKPFKWPVVARDSRFEWDRYADCLVEVGFFWESEVKEMSNIWIDLHGLVDGWRDSV